MGWLNNASSLSVSVIRLGRGLVARRRAETMPQQILALYEFESCPYCRKVRDVMTELDLEYRCYPCAKGSKHRRTAEELGGKRLFPFLCDPNTGVQSYESDAIIQYLHTTYGKGRGGVARTFAPLNTFDSMLGSALRPKGGKVADKVRDRQELDQPLTLFGFEASPYCRKVREALAELDLSYICKNVGKKSPRRPELVALGGKMMVPYLVDPNTGAAMYESDDIVAYLWKTYGPETIQQNRV